MIASGIRWIAGKIAEPGVGAAFAGVFVEAISDPGLREILSTRFQEPYRLLLVDELGLPADRVLLFIDIIAGTLLHRMGMTGAPIVESDVVGLTETVLYLLK